MNVINTTLVQDILNHLIQYLGVNGQIEFHQKDHHTHVVIRSEQAGRLIGRNGRTLQAIRQLTYAIIKKDENAPEIDSLTIDVVGTNETIGEQRKKRSRQSNDRRRNHRGKREHRSRHQRTSYHHENRRRRHSPRKEIAESIEEKPLTVTQPQGESLSSTSQQSAPELTPLTTAKDNVLPTSNPHDSVTLPQSAGPSSVGEISPSVPESAPIPSSVSPERENLEQKTKPENKSEVENTNIGMKSPYEGHFRYKQALDAMKEARRWGEPVTLPPMNEEDRKIVREVLSSYPDIEVIEGEVTAPYMRRVIVRVKEK